MHVSQLQNMLITFLGMDAAFPNILDIPETDGFGQGFDVSSGVENEFDFSPDLVEMVHCTLLYMDETR
jgi:hypothetical protein